MDWRETYNSAKETLCIPEYGRHVQELVDHARTLEDAEYRQKFAERIVKLMEQMTPQNKNFDDYRAKLWRHLFRIADNKLDVSPPEDINVLEEEPGGVKPDQLEYPKQQARFRHYGHNVQTMIQKAIAMEEGPKRDGFIAAIAAYMKLAYKTWNRDHYVSDEVIKADLVTLSKGALSIPEDQSLNNLVNTTRNRNNRRKGGLGGHKKNSGAKRRSGSGYSSNRGRKNNGGRRYKK